MKVTITCKNGESAELIYDTLIDPLKGEGCLKGEKVCLHEHEMVPDIMEFDLSEEEITELQKHEDIVSVMEDDTEKSVGYNKTQQTGIPKLASYSTVLPNGNSVEQLIPHSLYYCQNYNLNYTHQNPSNGTLISLSSIDCSNVDVLILDSGVDKTHPEFKNGSNQDTVVNFDWTQLKTGDPIGGTQIVGTQSVNYYQDTYGHGTACASLIAGKNCGFAKNAKIYALRDNSLGSTIDGFNGDVCLQLAIAFQKAKKLNLFGLLSSRPTVFSNSWGYTGPYMADDFDLNDNNNLIFSYSFNNGKSDYTYNQLAGVNSTADAYFREALNQGVHVLCSAGNSNIYLTNNPVSSISLHNFRKNGTNFCTVRTEANDSLYILNNVYNSYTYGSITGSAKSTRYLYTSPNVGLNYSKSTYPLIVVGDIIPVGYNDNDSDYYWSGANAKSAFDLLSSNPTDSRIIQDTTTRYQNLSGPFFIKSAYSSFGPDVDIYAPGNGTWAALSNQVDTTVPTMTAASNQRYQFFNGTSASCPIVAGILATFLSEYPDSTPSQAKQWLTENAINGNIMKTQNYSYNVNNYDGTNSKTLNIPVGCNLNNLSTNAIYKLQRISGLASLYRTGTMDDLLFCNRFFDSANLVAQAFPLRKAVLKTGNNTVTIGNTTLTRSAETTENVTHTTFS